MMQWPPKHMDLKDIKRMTQEEPYAFSSERGQIPHGHEGTGMPQVNLQRLGIACGSQKGDGT